MAQLTLARACHHRVAPLSDIRLTAASGASSASLR
jgi:hypothetical protein